MNHTSYAILHVVVYFVLTAFPSRDITAYLYMAERTFLANLVYHLPTCKMKSENSIVYTSRGQTGNKNVLPMRHQNTQNLKKKILCVLLYTCTIQTFANLINLRQYVPNLQVKWLYNALL